MRGNSDKQTKSFTTGQTTSGHENEGHEITGNLIIHKDHSLTKSNRTRQNAGIRDQSKQIPNVGVPYNTTLPVINID